MENSNNLIEKCTASKNNTAGCDGSFDMCQNICNINKPVLVVLAAGMGSRYGGLKQIDPVGSHGQLIIDYSIYDARRAGFETIVFIINHSIEAAFKKAIGDRLSQIMDVKYVYQELEDLPIGYEIPAGRTKPWGTCHAVMAARNVLNGPFAVINADDYYGPKAFQIIFNYLESHRNTPKMYEFAMVGYRLESTVTEHGCVTRGICEMSEDNFLTKITERRHIEKFDGDARFTEDDGRTWTQVSGETTVSMNLWGFTQSLIREAEVRFPHFLERALDCDSMKAEYLLPTLVNTLIDEGVARVKVLNGGDEWFGVTHQSDKPAVVAKIAKKIAEGEYPENLWVNEGEEDVVPGPCA